MKIVLERFNMHKFKPVTTTLSNQFRLFKDEGAKSDEEKVHMKIVSYA